MRAIKFRGKYIHDGKWIYGYFKKNSYDDCYIENEYGLAAAVDPDTVSQLVCVATGGDEIYEGDIVKNLDDNSIWHVAYSPNEMGFTVALVKPGEFGDTDFEMRWLEDCSVIGNIWDDNLKDFIKEEEE